MKDNFNNAFHINGLKIAYGDLSEVAYSLVKEGEPFEREIGDFLLDWISESPVIHQQTSGSTGVPREIDIPKSAMVSSARATGEFFQLTEGSRALLCLPAASVAGKMMLVRAMVLGWELTMVDPSGDPLSNLDQPFDFVAMVPMQLSRSLDKLKGVKTVLLGGAPLSAGLLAGIPVQGTVVYEGYGMTETSSHVALRELSAVPEKTNPEQVLPPFSALPGITLEQDERGCLVIHAVRLSPEPIVTNDLVTLESPEEFRWLGRVDNVVNSGGVKLLPEQLETRLSPYMNQRFFLAGMSDEILGEKLVLVVEGQVPDNLLETLREGADLSKYEVPRETFSVPEFALTPTGKIHRPEVLKSLS